MYIQANSLLKIEPLTDNQKKLFKSYAAGKNVFASGVAGSGKTFMLLFLALSEVLDVGFLPGTIVEKSDMYQDPYRILVRLMFSMPNDTEFAQLYDKLLSQGSLEFISTSFLRGQTFDRAIIICDEFQNMLFHELDTLMTRIGQESKIMFAGDVGQTDLKKYNGDREGVAKFQAILNTMSEVECIEFGFEDIIRSGLVRNYLIAKANLGFKTQDFA